MPDGMDAAVPRALEVSEPNVAVAKRAGAIDWDRGAREGSVAPSLATAMEIAAAPRAVALCALIAAGRRGRMGAHWWFDLIAWTRRGEQLRRIR